MMQDRPGAGDHGRWQPSATPLAAVTDPAGLADPDEMQSAFDNAPIAIALVTPLGVITTCNPALGGLLGIDPQSMLGATLFDVTHPDDLHEAYRQCALMQAGAAQIVRHECRLLQSNGTVIWVLVSTSRVPEVS
jgi:PAS domain S-box-containing protein